MPADRNTSATVKRITSGEPEKYDTRHVRTLMQDAVITCWGSVTLMLGDRNLLASSPAARALSVKYVKDTITMVKELGGQEITIVPCTVGKLVPEASPYEEWQWAVASLKECYEHGMKEGVRLALEPLNRFETYFLNRHDQALLLAEQVGPHCGVCLDVFHMNIEERDMLAAIQAAGPRLHDVHVADNNRMACGMGALDWPRIIGAVKAAGYDGALTVEFVAPLDRTPANPYTNMLAAETADMTPDERKFMIDHGTGDLSNEFYTWLVDETIKTLRPVRSGASEARAASSCAA